MLAQKQWAVLNKLTIHQPYLKAVSYILKQANLYKTKNFNKSHTLSGIKPNKICRSKVNFKNNEYLCTKSGLEVHE